MPIEALVWVTFLAPFVIWPPIVIAIMRRMDHEPEADGSRTDGRESAVAVASGLVGGRREQCGASIVLVLGPAAQLIGHDPAVVCLERLLSKQSSGRVICAAIDNH